MKTGKYHIFYSRILLICFIAGQYMVYAHQHPVAATGKVYNITKNATPAGPTFKEKCDLCDVMHHNAMMASYQAYFNPVAIINHTFKSFKYRFTSFRLKPSGGRAPPIANS